MEFRLHTTFGEGRWNEQFRQTALFGPDGGEESFVINLYPEVLEETLEGFGGAITDSAGSVYAQMRPEQKREFLEACFGADRMNYQMVRVPLDSCDFSLEQYEAVSDPEDRELRSFSMERMERYILPMLRDAQEVAGRPLELMLSPWSPPAFMKTNGRRERGGKLKPEYADRWAEYLCRYILEFRKRGVTVRRMTLQNEPKAVQPWDSCVYTAREERDFLVRHMAPAMVRNGVQDVEIFVWDHNKERLYDWMREILDEEAAPLVAGGAFHWYSGDHFEVLDLARRRFPDKRIIASESCIEFSRGDIHGAVDGAQKLGHELIGDLNHGMTAFYDWNMLLDETGGPNYVGNNCLAPFLYDTKRGLLMPQLLQQYLEHVTGTLLPGSRRIGFSRFGDEVEVTAWKRPDGALAVILLNRSEESRPVVLRLEGQSASCLLCPRSITSGLIR